MKKKRRLIFEFWDEVTGPITDEDVHYLKEALGSYMGVEDISIMLEEIKDEQETTIQGKEKA